MSGPSLQVHGVSDVGLQHDRNEDAFAIAPTEDDGTLLLICDGMGGMGQGDRASRLATEALTDLMCSGTGFPPHRIEAALIEADRQVREALCVDPRLRPGCTAAIAYVLEGLVHVGWVGDSRVYHFRDGHVRERTRDHKLVEDLVEAGHLSEAEARSSALSSVITRSLGGRPPGDPAVEPDLMDHPWTLETGDVLLVCSDGLSDLVTDEELPALVTDRTPEEACRALVQLALERGGHDNITMIVARWVDADALVDEPAPPAPGPGSARPSGRREGAVGQFVPTPQPPPGRTRRPPDAVSGRATAIVLVLVVLAVAAAALLVALAFLPDREGRPERVVPDAPGEER